MEKTRLKSLLESLIFVAEEPLRINDLHLAIQNFEENESSNIATGEDEFLESDSDSEEIEELSTTGEPSPRLSVEEQITSHASQEESKTSRSEIAQALEELSQEYLHNPDRGILLTEVANAWQFRTRPENAAIIRQVYQPKATKISKPSLETLAIVAYRQPITRVEIDEIRGVDSGGVLKTLLEKNLVRIVGKKEEPGRPMLYGTTQDFLELFQLKSLKDLPTLKEFRELEEEFQRKTGAEGVVVENIQGDSDEQISALEESAHAALEILDEEEEEVIQELEMGIKDLRHLEREIFPGEKKEETPVPSTSETGEKPPDF
jgi:segregation and condensation protein B